VRHAESHLVSATDVICSSCEVIRIKRQFDHLDMVGRQPRVKITGGPYLRPGAAGNSPPGGPLTSSRRDAELDDGLVLARTSIRPSQPQLPRPYLKPNETIFPFDVLTAIDPGRGPRPEFPRPRPGYPYS
jgi:hypothetical protein